MESSIIVRSCDKCGIDNQDNPKSGIVRFSVYSRSRGDAAGDSEELDYVADLCIECQSFLFRDLIIFKGKEVIGYLNTKFKRPGLDQPLFHEQ